MWPCLILASHHDQVESKPLNEVSWEKVSASACKCPLVSCIPSLAWVKQLDQLSRLMIGHFAGFILLTCIVVGYTFEDV